MRGTDCLRPALTFVLFAAGCTFPTPRTVDPGELRGTVVLSDTGTPAADALVRLEGTRLETRADSDGKFVLEGVPEGSFTLRVSMEERSLLLPEVAMEALPLGGTEGRDLGTLEVGRVGVISGEITENGAAVADATVAAALGGQTRTDASGRFELSGFAAGTYDLVVERADGTLFVSKRVTLEPDGAVQSSVELTDLDEAVDGMVSGTLLQLGNPDATGMRVDLSSATETVSLGVTDADGHFTSAQAVRAGVWTLTATATDGAALRISPVIVNSDLSLGKLFLVLASLLGDDDADGIPDDEDNCPSHYDPEATDLDGDEQGDLCDDDVDGDGVANVEDIELSVEAPGAGVAGEPVPVRLSVLDFQGRPALDYRGTLTLTSTDPNAQLPVAHTFTAEDEGVWTASVVFQTAGTQTVTATDEAAELSVTTSPQQVTAGEAASLGVVAPTQPVQAGVAFDVTVAAADAFGNTVIGFTETTTLSTDEVGGTPATLTFVDGVATGSVIFTSVGTHTVTVTAGALTGSVQVAVRPGPATLLELETVESALVGVPFELTATVSDDFGNRATDFAGQVLFALADEHALIEGHRTFEEADAGVLEFTVTLSTTAPVTIGVSSEGLSATAPISVTTSAPTVSEPVVSLPLRGVAPIEFTLVQAESRPVSVRVEYGPAAGPWRPITLAPGGEGTLQLKASPTGVTHTVQWDTTRDFPLTEATDLLVRVTPVLDGVAAAFEDEGVWVDNRLAFAAPVHSAAGADARVAVEGDFDGDGDLDAAVVQRANNVVGLHFNDGTGVFAAPVTYEILEFNTNIDAGDFDGDGDLDLVLLNDKKFQQFNNDGTGVLTPLAVVEMETVSNVAVATGDLNGDGLVDVVVADIAMKLSVHLSVGGTLGAGTLMTGLEVMQDVALVDVDGDDHLDAVAATPFVTGNPSITWYPGAGDGSFGAGTSVPLMNAVFDVRVTAGDLNDDGLVDLVSASSDRVSVLMRESLTTWKPVAEYPLAGNSATGNLELADLDGNGAFDVVLARREVPTMVLLPNDGSGVLGDPMDLATAGECIAALAGDFNGDGTIDLAGTSVDPAQVSLFLNTTPQSGGSALTGARVLLAGRGVLDALPADLDADGHQDLVVLADAPRELIGLRGLGGGAFESLGLPLSLPDTVSFAMGDVDVDGVPDLVTVDTHAVTIHGAPGTAPLTLEAEGARHLALNDLDRDGRLDVIWAATGTLSASLNRPDGFAPAVSLSIGAEPTGLRVADFTGDGAADLVVVDAAGDELLFAGVGDGTFTASETTSGWRPNRVEADVTGDGVDDFITVAAGLEVVPSQTGAQVESFTLPESASRLYAADLNGDGRTDLLVPFATAGLGLVFGAEEAVPGGLTRLSMPE